MLVDVCFYCRACRGCRVHCRDTKTFPVVSRHGLVSCISVPDSMERHKMRLMPHFANNPSVNQCDGEAGVLLHLGARGRAEGRRAPSRAGLRPAVGARRRATTDPCPARSRRERRPPRGPQGTGAAEHPAGPPPAHYPGSSAAP